MLKKTKTKNSKKNRQNVRSSFHIPQKGYTHIYYVPCIMRNGIGTVFFLVKCTQDTFWGGGLPPFFTPTSSQVLSVRSGGSEGQMGHEKKLTRQTERNYTKSRLAP